MIWNQKCRARSGHGYQVCSHTQEDDCPPTLPEPPLSDPPGPLCPDQWEPPDTNQPDRRLSQSAEELRYETPIKLQDLHAFEENRKENFNFGWIALQTLIRNQPEKLQTMKAVLTGYENYSQDMHWHGMFNGTNKHLLQITLGPGQHIMTPQIIGLKIRKPATKHMLIWR